jgi:type II secretion system protein H
MLRNSLGFTLIELVLVCVVLGVLIVTSVPTLQRTARRLRAEHTVFELAQLMRYARQRAVAEGSRVLWAWDRQTRRAKLYDVAGTDGDLIMAEVEERLARSAALDAAATLEWASTADEPLGCPDQLASDAECVSFLPDGTSEPVAVTVHVAGATRTITVDEATGLVVVIQGSVAR